MAEQRKVVAVLVANPALRSILSMVLAAVPALRVRPFESQLALTTYMRLAPVDLVVADLDGDSAPADRVAFDLRADPTLESPHFQMIALAGRLTGETRQRAAGAGIDEIIVKPMSPKYLLERVLARLQRRSGPPPRRPAPALPLGGNVIPLFGPRPETLH
jgi:DNA-binding response OmpR family regulator